MWHAAMQLQLLLLLFCLGNMPPHAATAASATLEAAASDNLAELQPATATATVASDDTKSTDNSHSNLSQSPSLSLSLSHKATDPSLKNDQSLYLTLANTNANANSNAAAVGATKSKLVDGKYEAGEGKKKATPREK